MSEPHCFYVSIRDILLISAVIVDPSGINLSGSLTMLTHCFIVSNRDISLISAVIVDFLHV